MVLDTQRGAFSSHRVKDKDLLVAGQVFPSMFDFERLIYSQSF